MSAAYDAIMAYVAELEIIDTHEHLPPFEDQRDGSLDAIQEYLIHYFNRDLVSAGMPPDVYRRVIGEPMPVMARWELAEPYWELCRYTGYGRALDIAVEALYGLPGIHRKTVEAWNEAVCSNRKAGHYEYVLREKSKIVISLLDGDWPSDRRYFRNMLCLDAFVAPRTLAQVREVEASTGLRICAFEDWLEACEITLDRALAAGYVGLKSPLAYRRSLLYERVPRYRAEESFVHFFDEYHYPDWVDAHIQMDKPFQDYMMHHVLRLANERGLTFQFHTGLQEGNGNLIANSNPELLSNLFAQYPDVRFDLFHIGYPYEHVLSALAKNYANVFIDMCWAHIISPQACVSAMLEWIDSVPLNKISAFGGDYCFIDAVYGHQQLAREDVARALTTKVEQGLFDVDRACEIARLWFHDNPMHIFQLEGKL